MELRCANCQQPFHITVEDLGKRGHCPHCQHEILLPPAPEPEAERADQTPPPITSWWEGSVSTLASVTFHAALVLILALWTYGGQGLGGDGEEVLIGQLPGETLTEQENLELSSEIAEQAAESSSSEELLELVEPPSTTLSDSTTELLAVASPSASGGSQEGLEFDVAISSSGGTSGGWDGLIQTLRRNGLDIVIVFDSTGSMGGEIYQVRRQIERIATALIRLVPKTRVSLCTYRDYDDEYVVKGIPLTSDVQQMSHFLDGVTADGGGDYPEAVDAGMRWALTENEFNPRARKVILIFGDAPPHAPRLPACVAMATSFYEQHGGVVSTVTCRSPTPLAEFVQIARAGRGEAYTTGDERELMTQLMVLVFGSGYRSKVIEAFRLMER
jgi:Mg-chelatase subunit ChlD/DNA-directed RNA polymerase subunit RPC12/RpoP